MLYVQGKRKLDSIAIDHTVQYGHMLKQLEVKCFSHTAILLKT